ncbi:hypothetical protein V5735_24100 (plasmid) [Haladaptatus sp. SPP-AMP-3]|uniref:hypothetical protein n=1 Tax=Haladaptatus sp. SPP-AMP-3 TaxID=3121295 RepID=UPI003C2F8040
MLGKISSWLQHRRFDVDAAILGLLLALGLFPLRFFASQIYIKTIPIFLGLGCALYLLAVRNNRASPYAYPSVSRSVAQLLSIIGFVIMTVMVIEALHAGERSPLFHILSGGTGTLILLQILFVDDEDFRPSLLLIQILSLAFVIRFMALYTTQTYIGIDIWTHMTQLAQGVYNQHSLAAMNGNKHIAAPLYHLLVVSASMLYDVSLRNALYLSVGVVMPMSILLVYGAAKLMTPIRWAVFAAMLYSFSDYFFEWGIHLIPTSHGLLFFIAIIFGLLRIMQLDYDARDFGLLVFLSVAIILTHQVSTFIMLVVLLSGLLAQLLLRSNLLQATAQRPGKYRKREQVNLAGLLTFDLGLMTFMWSFTPYNGNSFMETVLLYLEETLVSSAGFLQLAENNSNAISLPPPTFTQQVVTYIDTMGFLILFGLTVVGCLYILRRKRMTHSQFTLLFATVVMTVFTLGLPMFGIRNFIPQRWFAFLYVPMAILAAFGVKYLVNNLNRQILVATLLVVAMLYPSVMVISSHGTIDSPLFPDEQGQLTYTESEIVAVHTIGTLAGSSESAPDSPVLRMDQPYNTVFNRTGAYPADVINLSVTGGATNHPMTVYRTAQSSASPKFVLVNRSANASVPVRRSILKERICRPNQSVLYNNGEVLLCVNRTI